MAFTIKIDGRAHSLDVNGDTPLLVLRDMPIERNAGILDRRVCQGSLYLCRQPRAGSLLQNAADIEEHQNLEHATDDKCRGNEKHFLNKREGTRSTQGLAAGLAIAWVILLHDTAVRLCQRKHTPDT